MRRPKAGDAMIEVLLGEGREGCVYRRGDEVVKVFKEGVMSDLAAQALGDMLTKFGDPFPEKVRLEKESGRWVVRYPFFESEPIREVTKAEVVDYLIRAARLEVIADNFKPANIRRRQGSLVYIDIGKHIRPFNRSTFRDVCAKAFLVLGGADEDWLVTEYAKLRESGGVERLPGFSSFYQEVVSGVAADYWARCPALRSPRPASDVTLLLKCCAMDASYLERQVGHIVHRLSTPTPFAEVVLAVDTRESAFLRQHAVGSLRSVRRSALRLIDQAVISRVIEAPDDPGIIAEVNDRWFGLGCIGSHTASGIPVYPQLWAFEQVRTRYVLQADCDVLIHRQDFEHDYLSEMLAAHAPAEVMGVGFNIPQPQPSAFKEYGAPGGEYKPEVRLGLFDVPRLRSSTPWANEMAGESLRYGWYQSLHRSMRLAGWRCLRGGDPRTTYVHPLNSAKQKEGFLGAVRRNIESGFMPSAQLGKWDVVEDARSWTGHVPDKGIWVILESTGAQRSQAGRCVMSLAGQTDSDFAVLVLEDKDMPARTAEIAALVAAAGLKLHVVPGLEGLGGVISAGALGIRLRTDEALMSATAVAELRLLSRQRGSAPGGCYCDSAELRRSTKFGLGGMYDKHVGKMACGSPRCLRFDMGVSPEDTKQATHPSCVTLDVFSEIPPAMGNVRPPVMAGFIVWKDLSGQVS